MEKQDEQRSHPRIPVNRPEGIFLNPTATVLFEGRERPVVLSNISLGGVLFQCPDVFKLGDIVAIIITGRDHEKLFHEQILGRVVTTYRHEKENAYGLQFATLLDAEACPALVSFLTRRKVHPVSFLRNPEHKHPERKG